MQYTLGWNTFLFRFRIINIFLTEINSVSQISVSKGRATKESEIHVTFSINL